MTFATLDDWRIKEAAAGSYVVSDSMVLPGGIQQGGSRAVGGGLREHKVEFLLDFALKTWPDSSSLQANAKAPNGTC